MTDKNKRCLVNLDIDPSLRDELKIAAIRRGCSMSALIVDLIRRELKIDAPKSRKGQAA